MNMALDIELERAMSGIMGVISVYPPCQIGWHQKLVMVVVVVMMIMVVMMSACQ